MANFMGYVQSSARSRKQELQEFEISVDREDPDQLVKLRELQHMKAVGDAMAKATERGDYFLSETPVFQVKDCDVIVRGMMRDGQNVMVTVFVRRSVFHDVRDAYERRQNAEKFVDLETVRIFNLKGHAERTSILARLRRTTKRRSPGDGRLIRKYYRKRIAIDWDNALLRTR